jgi:hypothetical protein
MFSLIYNVKNGGNLPKGHEAFAKEVYARLQQCVLLQQIFLPHSDIHHAETTVFRDAVGFRELYESFGGDVALKESRNLELAQILNFAEAFFGNTQPINSFSLDEVTDSRRDEWLPIMHVGSNADYSQFADAIRRNRSEAFKAMQGLTKVWADRKPSFNDVLENEFSAFGAIKKESLIECHRKLLNPDNDPMALL